ncbi:MAG: hypothetical protein M3O02_08020, partial [Acidobacteriota bacterium]|nr:hypothetical protein [Acidobacteriota bacterium]
LYACDEVAMVRGPLPKIAVLGPSRIAQPELVKLQVGHIAHAVESGPVGSSRKAEEAAAPAKP